MVSKPGQMVFKVVSIGSLLGPLLFILHINSIYSQTEHTCMLMIPGSVWTVDYGDTINTHPAFKALDAVDRCIIRFITTDSYCLWVSYMKTAFLHCCACTFTKVKDLGTVVP